MALGHSAVGGRFISVGSDPSGFSRVMLMAINPRDKPDAMRPFREALSRGDAALKKYIAQLDRKSVV